MAAGDYPLGSQALQNIQDAARRWQQRGFGDQFLQGLTGQQVAQNELANAASTVGNDVSNWGATTAGTDTTVTYTMPGQYLTFSTPSTPAPAREELSIREQLQAEVDEWLSDAIAA